MLTYYSRLLDGVEKVIKILEILLLAAITLIMIYQCIMRYGFHSARPWCEELALYLSIYSVFLGIPIAVRRDSHLQVDFLLNFMSSKTRYLISGISSVVAAVFMIFFCKYGVSLIGHATGASTTLPIKMRDVYYAFPVGAVLMVLYSIESAIRNFQLFQGKIQVNNEEGEK